MTCSTSRNRKRPRTSRNSAAWKRWTSRTQPFGFFRITLWQYLHIFDYGKYHWLVALTVGAALVGVVLWGTLSGAMLPFLLRRCGLDPAASSAPFVATLVDVTGLVIYFNVALFVLRGTLL